MKLWCFGYSNTYGYDPCGFFGGRYAAPWPALLAEKTCFQVINDGKNGRMIPEREYEFLRFHRDAERCSADMLIIMLGTNDLLSELITNDKLALLYVNPALWPRQPLFSRQPVCKPLRAWAQGYLLESRSVLYSHGLPPYPPGDC